MTSEMLHASLRALGPAAGELIARHLDPAFRAMARGDGVVESPQFLRVLTGEPHPLGNFAVVSGTAGHESLAAAVLPLIDAELPSAVFFPGLSVRPEVSAWLQQRGYAAPELMPAMGVDIDRLPASALPAGLEFIRVESEDDAGEWQQQFATGYELPTGVAHRFRPRSIGSDSPATSPLQYFAIRRSGTIVATSVLFLHEGVAGIYCVSTIPAERRRGLGEFVTAEPLRLAARQGYRVGVLQSSSAGHPVYSRMGFRDLGGVPIAIRIPPK
jgi:hypothetical protein